MFDLEKAIVSWRRSFRYRRVFFEEDLEELERHVRDHVARLVGRGFSEKEAFGEAVRGVGDYGTMEAEYRKVFWSKLKHRRSLLRELVWEVAMLKNYLKVALRTVRRQKGYALINVAGLTLGITACLLIVLFVQDEFSYDRFHAKADQVYRVAHEISTQTAVSKIAGSPGPLAAVVQEEVPEVAQIVRLYRPFLGSKQVGYEDKQFYEDHFLFADATFFELFTFPLIRGNPKNALAAPYTVLLTEATAKKYFGPVDPMGQTLTVVDGFGTHTYTITGVLQDLPSNTHVKFDFLASFMTLYEAPFFSGLSVDEWTAFNFYTYVAVPDRQAAEHLETKLTTLYAEHAGVQDFARPYLQSVTDIHLYSKVRQELEPGGDVRYSYILSAAGLFLLLIACINFMNLATARFSRRVKEVGLRKVVGANRRQLIQQFLGESLLLSLMATALAPLLVQVLLPGMNQLTDKHLSFQGVGGGTTLMALVGLVVVVGLVAGSYPAFFLSSFQPASILKKTFKVRSTGARLRKNLVVFQFVISSVLIICTLVVYQQLGYIQAKALGFDKTQTIVVPVRDRALRGQIPLLERELSQDPRIRRATAASEVMGAVAQRIAFWPAGTTDQQIWTHVLSVDFDFLETMDIALLKGRGFSPDFATEAGDAIVLNEAAVKELGWEDPIGQKVQIGWGGSMGTVVGVVQDFHFESLHKSVGPLAMLVRPNRFQYLIFKIASPDVRATLAALRSMWEALLPDSPFGYSFLDADLDNLYREDRTFGRTFGVFAFLDILISCLGLFGLAAFTAEQRTKEIGIRKALGASVASVVGLLSRDFLKLVGLAFVLAVPVAYVAMHRWLQDFAYHIEISWRIFLMAGSLALAIAVLTVSYQAIKAALADPVKALRYE